MATIATDLAAAQIAMVAAAKYTYEHNPVAPNVFTRMPLGKGNKSQTTFKFASGGLAWDLEDGVDMTNEQALTITTVDHTTDEAGCKVIVSRKLRNQMTEDVMKAGGKVIGNMMSRKMDRDGLALLSGFSNGFTNAGTVLSLGYLSAAVSQLDGQSEPCPRPLVMAVHPHQLNGFVDQLVIASNGQNFPSELVLDYLRNHWRGNDKIYGVSVMAAGNLQNNTSGTTTGATGAIFNPSAFIYLVGWEPTTWVEEDPSGRFSEIGISADYGMAEDDDNYGRFMNFDNAAPTS